MRGRRSFIELTYYETYYFANIVKNVLEDPLNYLRSLDEFHGEQRYLAYTSPFPRFSAFHSFIHFVLDDVLSDDVSNIKLDIRQDAAERFKSNPQLLQPHPSKLPVNLALEEFGIDHQGFDSWLAARGIEFLNARNTDVESYYDELRLNGQLGQLLEKMTAEVFFVLFQNRQVLLLFNQMMADAVKLGAGDESLGPARDLFARPGVLQRVPLPAWVRRAVFFRDRGMCVLCATDLSGVLSIGSEENYDHMVPLAGGGLNDVSNIQLLCRRCNEAKQAGRAATTNRHEAWYNDRE